MTGEKLVLRTEIVLKGNRYEILVYCREDGRHIARTCFGNNDIIINDGRSLEEVLAKHERVLPLAVTCRQFVRQIKGETNSGN